MIVVHHFADAPPGRGSPALAVAAASCASSSPCSCRPGPAPALTAAASPTGGSRRDGAAPRPPNPTPAPNPDRIRPRYQHRPDSGSGFDPGTERRRRHRHRPLPESEPGTGREDRHHSSPRYAPLISFPSAGSWLPSPPALAHGPDTAAPLAGLVPGLTFSPQSSREPTGPSGKALSEIETTSGLQRDTSLTTGKSVCLHVHFFQSPASEQGKTQHWSWHKHGSNMSNVSFNLYFSIGIFEVLLFINLLLRPSTSLDPQTSYSIKHTTLAAGFSPICTLYLAFYLQLFYIQCCSCTGSKPWSKHRMIHTAAANIA
ncbi:uncharacterized protein LOC111937568 [Cyanistes caeruleus]|uniref:uncharacterized protein LOC111937568 n=1 Tax=Cyanistes caeruleus TaxID=156563 RepID=UPI000CDB10A2|nr:uncharacterized protein LOC111937568 [Cyanistes caeruleus]